MTASPARFTRTITFADYDPGALASIYRDLADAGGFRLSHAVMVELKVVQKLNCAHRAQCLNDPRTTGLRSCLLMNFGNPRLEICRVVLDL